VPNPRRLSVGLENNRLALLLAVLHRHAGMALFDQDVFVNAVGGVRIGEPAADLAVVLAVASSLKGRPLPRGLAVFGEELNLKSPMAASIWNGRLIVKWEPEDAKALRRTMRGTQAAVHERDAYELWLAMLPTRTPRGVVVVDPPYEQTDERARISATLASAHRKWAHGVTVIWYPLKDRATHWRWKEQLRKLGIPKLLCVEHWLYDSDQPGIYNGAGLFIVNPPYAFTQSLPPLLQALRAALAPDRPRCAAAAADRGALVRPRPHQDRRRTGGPDPPGPRGDLGGLAAALAERVRPRAGAG
jgi:hypothetical protein